MLRHLLRSGMPTPRVLASNARVLVLEHLPDGPQTPLGWTELGRRLAQQHRTTGPAYGWMRHYAFGAQPINNTWSGDWPAFWADQRLRQGIALLPPPFAGQLASLCDRLQDFLPASPRPSLLHGDLWPGNILWSDNTLSGLIDPACYFGHAEVDLAMLTLFGAPPAAFFDAYGAPLPGWAQRRAIYQLWPALVHLRLFGDSYLSMVTSLLAQIDQIRTP